MAGKAIRGTSSLRWIHVQVGNNSAFSSRFLQTKVLLACLFAASSPALAQLPMSGAEAVREIDWSAIGPGSQIPKQMPASQSDDPVEVGFARQWLERVLIYPESPKLALEIVSIHRTPDDLWASRMEKELRAIVRDKAPAAKNTRVFCNSIGCLCYEEESATDLSERWIVYGELLGESGRRLGLGRSDLDAVAGVMRPGMIQSGRWELTIVRRTSPETQGATAAQADR